MNFLDNYRIRGNKFPEIIKYIKESEGCRIIEEKRDEKNSNSRGKKSFAEN